MGAPEMRILLAANGLSDMGPPLVTHTSPSGVVVAQHVVAMQRLVFRFGHEFQVIQAIVQAVEVAVMDVIAFGGRAVGCLPYPAILHFPTAAGVDETPPGPDFLRPAHLGMEWVQ